MSGFLILILNAVAYICTLVFFVYKKKSVNNIGIFLLLIYAISTIGSVWYYSYPMVPVYYPSISVYPLIYLYVCIVLCIFPMLQLDLKKIGGMEDSNIRKVLNAMSLFFSVICIIPLFQLMMKFSSIDLTGSFLGQMYENGEDKAALFFSGFGKILFSPIRHFSEFVILLFFYQLSKPIVNKKIILGLALCVCTIVLFKLMSGSRGGIVGTMFSLFFYFYFFKNLMPHKRFVKTLKVLGIVFLCIVLAIGMITISRYDRSVSGKKEQSVGLWVSQYAGEGFIRFTNTIWNMDSYAEGDHNFALLKSYAGKYNYSSYDQYLYQKGNSLKVILNVFYTYVGDFYIDLGRYGTLFFIVLVFFIEKRLSLLKSGTISIFKLYLLGVFFSLLGYGFSANVYRVIFIQQNQLYPIVLTFALAIVQKYPIRRLK